MKYLLIPVLLIATLAFSSSSRCPFCTTPVDKVKEARLHAIQREILDKLGLRFAPNVTNPHIPKIPPLLRLLKSQGLREAEAAHHSEEDNYHARTQRIIMFPEKAPMLIRNYPRKCCFFTFRGKANRLWISKATLDVYVKRKPNTTRRAGRNPQIKLYKRVFPITEGIPERRLFVAKPIRRRADGWYHFKIKRLLKQWRREPHMNLGIDVEFEDDDGALSIITEEDETKQPFLEVFTRDTGNKRRAKRKAGLDCHESSREKRCCRFELVVDFESFGWEWIIAPKRFNAYYCMGECQDTMLPMYPHANLVKKASGKTACCSPNKMSAISMIYFDDAQKIMHEEVPAMTAETCGCT